MIKIIKRVIKNKFPKFVKIFKILKENKNTVSFEGWGMATMSSNTPWYNNTNNKTNTFNQIHSKIGNYIKKGDFIDTTPGNDTNDSIETLEGLKWRHYIIFTSIDLIEGVTKENTFVECGVGDGLSISYALNKITKKHSNFYLYDSWQPMIKKYLFSKKENEKVGSYKTLNFEITKKNLKNFQHKIQYNKGYIPDVFDSSINPDKISWLHIDLNSSIPTLRCLEFFYDRIENNGVIVFDDYGWKGYEETKEIVDKFLNEKKGSFFQFPTGQGLFIKK
jgi:hypothetical protein